MKELNPILENLADPHELERMFREDTETFKKHFSDVWEKQPDSPVLQVWHERLNYEEETINQDVSVKRKEFFVVGGLALLAGICTRILFHFAEQETIAPINLVFGVLPFMAAYFIYRKNTGRKLIYIIAALFLMPGIYLNWLPMEQTDSVILAYLHLPVFLWVVLGLAFSGDEYKLVRPRIAYLKFNGEFCILYVILAITGMLLTALTLQLFEIMGMDISEFYFSNIVLFGAVSLAIVAGSMVTWNLKLARNMAPFIARIFGPLVLITLMAYLAMVLWLGKNPFLDRNFLLSFNGVLLVVLAIAIFSITESSTSQRKTISDYVNFALISLALVIDGIALASILFRLSAYGITPNRIAVLGVNVLIFGHLIWFLRAYMSFLKNKAGTENIQAAATRYLPVYGIWAAFVLIAFPLIFD